jgi:hypothetical protein
MYGICPNCYQPELPSRAVLRIRIRIRRKFFDILNVSDENSRIRIQHPDPDPLVRGLDPLQDVIDPRTLLSRIV